MNDETRNAQNRAPSKPPPLHEATAEVYYAVRQQFTQLLELFTLEIRYSGLMLSGAVAMAVIAGFAAFSVWGLINAATTMLMLAYGLNLGFTFATLACLNILIFVLALWLMKCALLRVGIDSTRQALGLQTSDASK